MKSRVPTLTAAEVDIILHGPSGANGVPPRAAAPTFTIPVEFISAHPAPKTANPPTDRDMSVQLLRPAPAPRPAGRPGNVCPPSLADLERQFKAAQNLEAEMFRRHHFDDARYYHARQLEILDAMRAHHLAAPPLTDSLTH